MMLSFAYFVLYRGMLFTSVESAKTPIETSRQGQISYRLPCIGEDAWRTQKVDAWEAFVRQFVPGLWAVVMGHISLVGLPPRSIADIQSLPMEWQALYQEGRAGLITETAMAPPEDADETHRYLSDAYYSAEKSALYDVRLGLQYLMRLILPAHE